MLFRSILEGKREGKDYAHRFLPLMQTELQEAISSCIVEEGLSREEAIQKISESCDDKSLPKLIDQFNYVKYTLRKQI